MVSSGSCELLEASSKSFQPPGDGKAAAGAEDGDGDGVLQEGDPVAATGADPEGEGVTKTAGESGTGAPPADVMDTDALGAPAEWLGPRGGGWPRLLPTLAPPKASSNRFQFADAAEGESEGGAALESPEPGPFGPPSAISQPTTCPVGDAVVGKADPD